MRKNDKIVVTGSTGMVGGELTLQLARAGYTNIHLPVRNMLRLQGLLQKFDAEGLHQEALHPAQAELNNLLEIAPVLEGAQVLFHCAAQVSFGDEDNGMVAANVEITSTLVDAALAKKVGKMVFVSSIAALGGVREGGLITERTPMESIEEQSPYSISKFLSEKQVLRGAAAGLKTIIVNPAVILGEGDWSGTGSPALIKLAASGIPFYTEGVTGYVDVMDVAQAMIILAGTSKAVGESFILCGANLSYRELLSKAALAAGKKPPRIKASKALLNILSGCERFLSLLGRRPMFSRMMVHSMTTKSYYDNSHITSMTGFEFTPIDETISRVVKAYLDDKNSGNNSGRR